MDSYRLRASRPLRRFAIMEKRVLSTSFVPPGSCGSQAVQVATCSLRGDFLLACSSMRTANRRIVSPMYTLSQWHSYLYTILLASSCRSLPVGGEQVVNEGKSVRSFVVVYAILTRACSLGSVRRMRFTIWLASFPDQGRWSTTHRCFCSVLLLFCCLLGACWG